MTAAENIISYTSESNALRDKNISFFEEEIPLLHDRIINAPEPASVLSFVDGKPDNVLVNGLKMYGVPCSQYSQNQMDEYWEQPERLFFKDMSQCNVTNISRGLMEKLNKRFFHARNDIENGRFPVVDSGYFFCFGLGLGTFIPEIVEKSVARNILIVEPLIELFYQSLSVVDWEEIYALAEENGKKIYFIFEKTPVELVEACETYVRKTGNTFLDGSYFFVHYPSWELKEAYGLLRERLRAYYYSTGFFEDELVMMRNCYQNLAFSDFRFVKRKKYLHQDYPVFVTASGPSLEFDLPNIKKIRDRIILVSSGTTLHLLLKEGITPDFHAELENVEAVYDLMKPKSEQYDLTGITLIASTTIDKRVPGLFGDVYLFARGAVSSTTVFCKGVGEINETSPYSANCAAATIATLGFRNIYLAGVDCGRYDGAKHHASGSVYEEIGIEEAMEGALKFDIKVPGNFGGEVSTTVLLDMSRRHITSLINRLGLKMYNCSHGARIDGTTPISSGGIKLTNEPNQQEHIKQTIRDQSKLYRDGEYVDIKALQKNVDNVPVLKSRLSELIEEAKQDVTSFYDFDHLFHDFWDGNWDDFGHLFIIMGGSLASMIRIGSFMGIRITNEDQRKEFFDLFLDCYEEQCIWMLDVIEGLYAEMVAGNENMEIPAEYELETM